jgi:hypothetical protein
MSSKNNPFIQIRFFVLFSFGLVRMSSLSIFHLQMIVEKNITFMIMTRHYANLEKKEIAINIYKKPVYSS